MKMNRNEMEALYAFGCPNLKATVERLRMVAALAPDPVAKKLFYMLSVKLSAEGVERWYRCFYCKLRVLKTIGRAAMTRLTKIEKETIVLFNEGEDKANIYTHNAGLKRGWLLLLRSTLTFADWKNPMFKAVFLMSWQSPVCLSVSCRLTVRNADRKPVNMRKSMG